MAKPKAKTKESFWNPGSEPITGFGRWFLAAKLNASVVRDTLGCSRNYAYDILAGRRTPSLDHCVALIELSKHTPKMRTLHARDFLPSDPG